jgi:hypothetical protein
MAIVTKTTLKTYFEQGDIPTQGQYVDLIDSNLNLGESETTQIIQGTISASAAIVGYVELKKMYIPGIGVGSATVGTTFTVGRSLEVIGDINTTGNISASGYLVIQNITASSNISASGDIVIQNITASSNISASGYLVIQNITASSNISASGDIVIQNITASSNISASGDIVIQNITASSNISASGYLVVQNITASSNISASGTIKGQSILATSNMGYTTGAGGTVTQLTSRISSVTINKICGSITLVSGVGSSTFQTFKVANSLVEETDVVVVSQKSGKDIYQVIVTKINEGEFSISCATTGITLESPVINFAIIKAVTS